MLLVANPLLATLRADSTVVFNEIMYHPAVQEADYEWLELHNQMAVNMDISSWRLAGGVGYQFPEGTVVPGGGYLVIAKNPEALKLATGLDRILGPFQGRLSNSGERLELRNNNDRLMDWIEYGVGGTWPVSPDGFGTSLSKRTKSSASAPPSNWRSSAQTDGTPGTDNFITPGITPEIPLIRTGEVWRIENSGEIQPSDWKIPGFSDVLWSQAPTPLYGGDAPSPGGVSKNIPSLFSSGIGDNGAALLPGTRDPHYTVTVSAEKVSPPPPAPALVIEGHPAWAANEATSMWLGPIHPGTENVSAGSYRYKTTFDLSGFVPETARVVLNIGADNRLNDVSLNGKNKGISFVGFSTLSPDIVINNGFQPGANTLEFLWANDGNGPNPGGLRVRARGSAQTLAAPESKLQPVRPTAYARKTFSISGNPRNLGLRFRATLDDGAAVYLNGHEVLRINLPEGPIGATTPAINSQPGIPSPIEKLIPSGLLVAGTNVLAIELHQADNGMNDAWLDVELWSRQVDVSIDSEIAINEVDPTTSGDGAFVELINRGTTSTSLQGWRIAQLGRKPGTYDFNNPTPFAPGAILSLNEFELGFKPSPGDSLGLYPPGRISVADAVIVGSRGSSRAPDLTGEWFASATRTPGGSNDVRLNQDIVINEIQYHPRDGDLRGSWIELFNRSSKPVDIASWKLDQGIRFQFPPATTLASGAYLVVAEKPDTLSKAHPNIAILGPYTNRLSRAGETIRLVDAVGNPVDSVSYQDSGRWPSQADGFGSSLELRDAFADRTAPEAWASSRQSDSGWSNHTYRAVAVASPGPTRWNEFILGLLDAGECLVDDLKVTESPTGTPVALIQNGDFENGTKSWRFLGTHRSSEVIVDPDNPGNHVLHLVATGPTEHMHNHLETTLAGNRAVVVGRTYEISFRAKWLSGNNQLNTRLYFNRAARTTVLKVPLEGGTPGAENSVHTANHGPTFSRLTHTPAVPKPNQTVEISAKVASALGIDSAKVNWSVNGGPWSQQKAEIATDGSLKSVLPGYTAGTIIQFYISATDKAGVLNHFPARGPNSRALYIVDDGRAQLANLHNLRIIMTPRDNTLLHEETNVMSNEFLGCTTISDEQEVFYDMGVHLQGSERGRLDGGRVGFTLQFPPDHLFRGVHDGLSIDRSGGYTGVGGDQDEIVLKHALQHAGGLPGMYDDLVRVLPTRADLTGTGLLILAKYGDEFLDTQYENGSSGNEFKLELVYYPTTTIGQVQDLKRPQPDDIVPVDIGDLGNDPEVYRWFFLQENNRDSNDYSQVMALAKAMSKTGTVFDTETQRLLDVDAWLRAFAFQSLFGLVDAYPMDNPHNFMFYFRPSDGRALPFLWDMDFNFGAGPTSPLNRTTGNAAKLLGIPANQRLFQGHFLDMITTTFNTNYLSPWIEHFGTMAGQNFSGIRGYVDQRVKSVRSQLLAKAPFVITSNAGQDFMVDTPSVQITGRAWIDIRKIQLDQRTEQPLIKWTTTTTWQMQVPLQLGTNQLAFLGYDFHGQLVGSNVIQITSTATTGSKDSDGDGMPDAWETQFGLDPANADGELDDDADGLSNQKEYLAGTNPRDRLSVLGLDAKRREVGLSLEFKSVAGRSYSLQSREGLGPDEWKKEADFPPLITDSLVTITNTLPEPSKAKFYRLVTPRIP